VVKEANGEQKHLRCIQSRIEPSKVTRHHANLDSDAEKGSHVRAQKFRHAVMFEVKLKVKTEGDTANGREASERLAEVEASLAASREREAALEADKARLEEAVRAASAQALQAEARALEAVAEAAAGAA